MEKNLYSPTRKFIDRYKNITQDAKNKIGDVR